MLLFIAFKISNTKTWHAAKHLKIGYR